MNKETEKKVCELFADHTIKEIAEIVGVSKNTIARALRRNCLTRGKGQWIHPDIIRLIVEMYKNGEEVETIKERVSIGSMQTIYRVLRNNNIKLRMK